jgi:ribosomal protein S18 acetylase RimI-like enzyme
MENFKIRKAIGEDAAGVAAVKYYGWQDTYKGIINDAYLKSMNVDELQKSWRKILVPENTRSTTDVMVNDAGEIIGFVSYGINFKGTLNADAEILALYVLKKYHGRGIGAKLFLQGIRQLQAAGVRSFYLYVLAQNPALYFYRKFNPDSEHTAQIQIGGNDYEEVGLVWRDIQRTFPNK